jgi:hypothetical protein
MYGRSTLGRCHWEVLEAVEEIPPCIRLGPAQRYLQLARSSARLFVILE